MEEKGEIDLDFYPRGYTILVFLTRGEGNMSQDVGKAGDGPLVASLRLGSGGGNPYF
jgi:hypothetical protein